MTPTSLVPEQAAHVGMSYAQTVPLDRGGRVMRSVKRGAQEPQGRAGRRPRAPPPAAARCPAVQPGSARRGDDAGFFARASGPPVAFSFAAR